MHYSLSRLSRLDAKWVDLFDVHNSAFFDQHHNPYYQLITVVDGAVDLDVAGNRMGLMPGECLILKPWETHTGWNPNHRSGTFFWVQFSCDPGLNEFYLDQAIDLNIVHPERTELRTIEARHEDQLIIPRRFKCNKYFELLYLFEKLRQTFDDPKGYFRFRATRLLSEMIQHIADDLLEQRKLDINPSASYLTFRRLAQYINSRYWHEITKEQLEGHMVRKYEYLCSLFRKYAHMNMHQYIHQLRTQRAKYLLHHTSRSVKEIAEEVGYEDPFYFSRTFKKITGVAPQRYRDNEFEEG